MMHTGLRRLLVGAVAGVEFKFRQIALYDNGLARAIKRTDDIVLRHGESACGRNGNADDAQRDRFA